MTPRSGAGPDGESLSVTGEAATAAEPAQAKTLSSLEAPKPSKQVSAEQVPTKQRPVESGDTKDAAIEVIEPSTGEIIVLAQHKPATKEGTMAKAAAEEQMTRQVTPLAKPEKRRSAKENAKAKLRTKPAEDETTPDMTATAKSNAGAKSAEVLAANEARKARKAAAKAGKGGTKAKKAR